MFSALTLLLFSLTSQQGDVVYSIPASISLTTPGSYATLIVESKNKNGLITDLTDEVSARIENPEIAMLFQGRVYGKKAGATRLLVDVQGQQLVVPVSFNPTSNRFLPGTNATPLVAMVKLKARTALSFLFLVRIQTLILNRFSSMAVGEG